MLKLNHKNLDVWVRSKDLVKEVYRLCEKLPQDEKYLSTEEIKDIDEIINHSFAMITNLIKKIN